MSLSGAWFKNGARAAALVTRAINFAASKGVLAVSAAANNGVNTQDYPALTIIPAMAGSGIAVSATGPIGWQATGDADFTRSLPTAMPVRTWSTLRRPRRRLCLSRQRGLPV